MILSFFIIVCYSIKQKYGSEENISKYKKAKIKTNGTWGKLARVQRGIQVGLREKDLYKITKIRQNDFSRMKCAKDKQNIICQDEKMKDKWMGNFDELLTQ